MAEQVDTLSKYGQSFQAKVISALLTDVRMMDTLCEIIDKKFFESDANKWIVQEIKDYYDEYKKEPTLDVFKGQVSKLDNPSLKKSVVEQLKTVYTQIGQDDFEYVKNEFTSFCINQNMKNVILQSVDLLKSGNYDRIKDLVDKAMKVGVESDLGMDYLLDFEERFSETGRETVGTGWECIDDLMGGGIGPGELGVVVAPSGVGKCVGGDTTIDIEYDEIGFELSNGYIAWFKPWELIRLGDNLSITAAKAEEIIASSGYGKTT